MTSIVLSQQFPLCCDMQICLTSTSRTGTKDFIIFLPFSVFHHLLVLALLWCDGVQDTALQDHRLVLPQRPLGGNRTASQTFGARTRAGAEPRGSVIHRIIGARLTDAATHRLPTDLPRYEGFGINLVQKV